MPRKTTTEAIAEQQEAASTQDEPQSVAEGNAHAEEIIHEPADRELDWKWISEQLSKPFAAYHIRLKPSKVAGNGQALALWYIDARAVMDRLDAVVGPENWEFAWDAIPADGRVVIQGRLTICEITKSDVGEARGKDEPWKSGVSDAFKRTAVQFGIGRFLYRLPQIWWPYDADGRKFRQLDELNEMVDRVMKELDAVDGDTSQIDVRSIADAAQHGTGQQHRDGREATSTEQSTGTAAPGRTELTPAQEGYVKRLYAQRFGRYSNGNMLFANFLKHSIGRVCPIEKMTRAEADLVIKGLQDTANAA